MKQQVQKNNVTKHPAVEEKMKEFEETCRETIYLGCPPGSAQRKGLLNSLALAMQALYDLGRKEGLDKAEEILRKHGVLTVPRIAANTEEI